MEMNEREDVVHAALSRGRAADVFLVETARLDGMMEPATEKTR